MRYFRHVGQDGQASLRVHQFLVLHKYLAAIGVLVGLGPRFVAVIAARVYRLRELDAQVLVRTVRHSGDCLDFVRSRAWHRLIHLLVSRLLHALLLLSKCIGVVGLNRSNEIDLAVIITGAWNLFFLLFRVQDRLRAAGEPKYRLLRLSRCQIGHICARARHLIGRDASVEPQLFSARCGRLAVIEALSFLEHR